MLLVYNYKCTTRKNKQKSILKKKTVKLTKMSLLFKQ